jgi:hypothetical protein
MLAKLAQFTDWPILIEEVAVAACAALPLVALPHLVAWLQ